MSSVSVVVPCYGYGRYLEACVNSALSQVGVDVRVLIIDDASPDATPEIARGIVARDGRVDYRRHPQNRGHIRTYNEGLEWASGDFSVVLSADDLLAPGSLARAARLMEANPNVHLVYGPIVEWAEGAPPPDVSSVDAESDAIVYPGMEWFEARCRTAANCIYSAEAVTRTSMQHKVGGYREDLPHAGDFEMWLRFAIHGDVGEVLGATQAIRRTHGQNMSTNLVGVRVRDWPQRRAVFATTFSTYGDLIPDRNRLRWVARRALYRDALRIACRMAGDRLGRLMPLARH